ncbi:hypothetical protein J2N86_13740 [Legionella lytica]|uniref:FG-GAP repeat protein n=1 Tax=Legionella lytica TaxID=96232 RepID=A0ABY4Y982_9GAMM|nr:hypothetical protein [Legionella lytica]USQ13717.1 hypothetical protein J2N86_13740 [Legionella lytica]
MMRFFLYFFLIYPLMVFSGTCTTRVEGYNLVSNSLYPFSFDKDKACFFAFYTTKPDVVGESRMDDNAIWYGYYKIKNPSKIYEYPRPLDKLWGAVCDISAVSFYDMDGDGKADITVIGSCNKRNAINYTYPFVFIRQGNSYVLDEKVYSNLFGFVGLNISDIRAYIAAPGVYYSLLKHKNTLAR